MKWRSLWVLFKKDLLDMSRNGLVIFLLLIPISISWLYGNLLTQGGLKPPSVILFDAEGNSAFANFIQKAGVFKLVQSPATWEQAQQLVKHGDAQGAIYIPQGIDAALASKGNPVIRLYLDESRAVAAAIIQEDVRELLRVSAGQVLPANLVIQLTRDISGRQADIPTWITIAILIVGINMVPMLLVEEKDKKTLDAILATFTSEAEIIFGKCLVGVCMALVMAIVILALNKGFVGNLVTLFTVLVLGSVSFVLIGLLIGSLVRNVQMASLVSSLILLPLVLGATMADISPAVASVSRFIPSYYLLDSIGRAMFMESPLPELRLHLLVLGIFALLAFFSSITILRMKST